MDYSGKIIKKTPVVPSQTSASGVWTLDEAMQATKSNTWPVANVPDPISRSLRFRASATAYLSRTPATTTNQKIFTWSSWNKLGALGTYRSFFSSATTNPPFVDFSFQNNDVIQLDIRLSSGTYQPKTTAVFRDPSAWYHIVVAVDTTQATEANRVKLYINGVQQTLSTVGVPQNSDLPVNTTVVHNIGRRAVASDSYFDGYMTEINFIDGQALTPSSFGGTNAITGVWEPRQYTGTYGTNGFLLTFSDITSTTTLGNDTSGNSNNWTTNNISLTAGSTYDSMLDVPTQWIGYNTGDVASVTRGNYCTLNPLDPNISDLSVTLSNGNLTASGTTYGATVPSATFQVPSTGKWYYETTYTTLSTVAAIGIRSYSTSLTDVRYRSDGQKNVADVNSSYGSSWTTNDVIGIAVNMDAGTVTFYKNNVSQGAISIPVPTATFNMSWNYVTYASTTFQVNFGQRPFAYTPPAGFLSLCTTNLPSPTILQGNQYFDATLYTGTGAIATITNSGLMQPDLVWVKVRSTTGTHVLTDSVRGANKQLYSNLTIAEGTATNKITGFTSTGFTLGADDGSGTGDANFNGQTYVGWQWRATGSTVSNTAGSVTSTVSANTTAGFSIVTWTATNATATIGHGLGVKPNLIIVRDRAGSGWEIYSSVLGATKYLQLNSTNAAVTASTRWNDTEPTSTVFTVTANLNYLTDPILAYCFAAVPGYSAFGSYTGNGSSDGPFVYTGFRPRYVMIKSSTNSTYWYVYDSARNTYNLTTQILYPNLSNAEATGVNSVLDLVSNGFKIRDSGAGELNISGATFIYMAFSENPFKNALAR